jgi:hypothetical protein
MKKNCDNCKANRTDGKYCLLRYRRKLVRIAKGIELFIAPDEECPKPRTWSEYFNTPEREGEGRR